MAGGRSGWVSLQHPLAYAKARMMDRPMPSKVSAPTGTCEIGRWEWGNLLWHKFHWGAQDLELGWPVQAKRQHSSPQAGLGWATTPLAHKS